MRAKAAALTVVALAWAGAQSAGRSVWDGVYTADQAKRGQEAYNQQCASCHGDTLGGGESAPALTGVEFLSNWNGLSVGELFDRTRTSMPQGKPGSLSRETNADILSYVLSVNQFPAGKTEMAHASEVLKEIRIDAFKHEPKK